MGMWGLKLMVLKLCILHSGFGFGKRNVEGDMKLRMH